jgi:hypothetical protein
MYFAKKTSKDIGKAKLSTDAGGHGKKNRIDGKKKVMVQKNEK